MCFDSVRVVVPCGDGTLLVRDLMHEAILRYKKATGKTDSSLTINSLSSLTGGGIFDPDDRLCDIADDREQILATFSSSEGIHVGGDGASSVGTVSPIVWQKDFARDRNNHINRESTKRLSMHVLSTREPCLTTYSAQSLPRESRRREPLGQDSKSLYEIPNIGNDHMDNAEIHEIVIKNEAGPLGLHVVPCYDLLGNDRGLRVEGIEPTGRIAKDGQIDLHDTIVKINGHNLLHIPFNQVQEIFRTCMNETCLRISVVKHKKIVKPTKKDKPADEDITKRLTCSNYNLLQTANTRKIGRRIEIDLAKGVNGLGFSVTTRDNPAGGHCPIYIKNILPKGAAVEDGRLKPGDRLLEVNNQEMTGKSQAEVVSLLRSIPLGGNVKILVSRQEEICSNTSSNSDVYVVPESDSAKDWKSQSPKEEEVSNSHSYKPLMEGPDDLVHSPKKNRAILTLDIPVHDSEKAGLGVSVKGKTSNDNVDLGIFIKTVINGGAASRDGRIRPNDQLLNVNGISLLGKCNSAAMETLRRAMLKPNSAASGVISLTIARRVSVYDSYEKMMSESASKLESANSIYITNSSKNNDDRKAIKEKNSLNSQSDLLGNDGILTAPSTTSWNPVIDRLTEQYNKSLRNESYCIATNKTWLETAKMSSRHDERLETVLLEDHNDNKKNSDDKDSQYSGDPTYDSQLSLEEPNSPTNKFSRDALGRQSMSEKRHAALDAKNTDTYKRNKKLRENRENKMADEVKENKEEMNKEKKPPSGEGSSFHGRKYEKKFDTISSDYLNTIPGCNNKLTSPRKHWLVDDGHGAVSDGRVFKDEGFSNARGDVKQASLNSALDERYKRSRKKGGIRSMLRLGKNRKSLNFGDNLETRHESNYCSGTINYIA